MRVLPDILIAIYMESAGVAYDPHLLQEQTAFLSTTTTPTPTPMSAETDGSCKGIEKDLKLAIQLDYYDSLLQRLERARNLDPFIETHRQDFVRDFQALPKTVQQHFATSLGVDAEQAEHCHDLQVLEAILQQDRSLSPSLQEAVEAADEIANSPEYNDIEFVDRSRFLEEFFPSFAHLENVHPSQADVDLFIRDCLSKSKAFIVTSRPERVVGGYYIRGRNSWVSAADEAGGKSVSQRMVERVTRQLKNHPTLDKKLDYFYMGIDVNPLIVVTAKKPEMLYQSSAVLTKSLVTFSGLMSSFGFSLGCYMRLCPMLGM